MVPHSRVPFRSGRIKTAAIGVGINLDKRLMRRLNALQNPEAEYEESGRGDLAVMGA